MRLVVVVAVAVAVAVYRISKCKAVCMDTAVAQAPVVWWIMLLAGTSWCH